MQLHVHVRHCIHVHVVRPPARHRRRNKFLGVGVKISITYDLAKEEVANFYGACDDIVVKILNLSVSSKNKPREVIATS